MSMTKNRIQPSWEDITNLKQPLTEGEQYLAEYLDMYLPEGWEIYLQPHLNGDQPDIVILNPNVGIAIFEVKDWKAGSYRSEETVFKKAGRKITHSEFFVVDSTGEFPVASPVRQVERYREKLIGQYLPYIGESIDTNPSNIAAFNVVLYLHNMTTAEAQELVPVEPQRCVVIGNNGLEETRLNDVVRNVELTSSFIMKDEWANEIRFWLMPPHHTIEQGQNINLSNEQMRHVEPSPGSHQRLRGTAGSGKSLVLAMRAANLASQGKKVLVVTYNITLWHYLRDLVSRARENFSWDQIEFTHFHGLCRDYLYENGIRWPHEERDEENFFEESVPESVMLSKRSGMNSKNRRYDAILIDEGQDFQKSWYRTLCEFLCDNDELLMVVDPRQNVYHKNLRWIDDMSGTKFRGRWRTLKKSRRLPPLIIEQTNRFAKMFIPEIGIDPVPEENQPGLFDPHLIWKEIESLEDGFDRTLKAVRWLTREQQVHPQDIVILVPSHSQGWALVEKFKDSEFCISHVFEKDGDRGHRNKKSFWMGDGRLKASTIHSFKGWELRNVILITPSDAFPNEDWKLDNIIYTALTRSRENIIVYNRHSRYQEYGKEWPKSWKNQST